MKLSNDRQSEHDMKNIRGLEFKGNNYTSMKKNSEKNLLRPEDYDALMRFDKTTGNILKYDKETGQLDQFSRKIIRETKIIHRLIENGMILPGGWLTPTGIKEFEGRKSKLKKSLSHSNGHQTISENISDEDGLNGSLSPQAEKFLHSLWNKASDKPFIVDRNVNDEVIKLKDEVPEKKRPTAGKEADQKKSENLILEDRDFKLKPPKILHDDNISINNNLITLSDPQSFEAEQFKILRTQIYFPLSGKIPRSIAITSAIQGEGKSFVAANTAVSIANDIDKYVLLIDCDLRRPKIHEVFGFKDNVPGLSEYLSGKVELSSVLRQTNVEKLAILPAGVLPFNPSELLSSDRMAAMLEEVSDRYQDRLIILDTPPFGMTAETGVLIRMVDAVLLVVRRGYAPSDLLKDLVKKIGHEKIIGSVFNEVDMKSIAQYGYRKYQKSYYNKKIEQNT